MKIVISTCHGGFGLSEAAVRLYADKKGLTLYPDSGGKFAAICGPTWWLVPASEREDQTGFAEWDYERRAASNKRVSEQQISPRDIPRDDADLIAVVETLGADADGRHASLKVVEIPDDAQWEIAEYDGLEWVAEKHRTWG